MWPSSKTCKRTLNTSGCAFSISSNKITENGFRLTFSESCPPSSCPTYPGGDPIILETLCFSIYSDISTRIIASSLPNTASASALDTSVFPTPVGPRNKKEPIGLFGSFNPTLPRRTAFATADTASSCPMTRLCKVSSNFCKRAASLSVSLLTGIFVHPATTSAISFSPTTGTFRLFARWFFLFCFSHSEASSSLVFFNMRAFSMSPSRKASSSKSSV